MLDRYLRKHVNVHVDILLINKKENDLLKCCCTYYFEVKTLT